MASHLYTMFIECILMYVVCLTFTASVSGIEIRKSPFGSLMCDRLCHHTVGCVYFFYAPRDLTCYLGNSSSALNREAMKITVSKVVGNTPRDISKCSRNSKTYLSRSRKLICFKNNKRRNIVSNDAQVSLKPAQPKTTTPTCRNNTAFVQCNDSIGLYQASEEGNLHRVRLIISKGLEDINCREEYDRRTPVMAAMRNGHEKVFDFLVSHCCDLYSVDYHNNSVMHLACKGGSDGIVKKLIDKGHIDANARGSVGKTSLMFAAKNGHVRLFKMLMSKGSNVKLVDDENNNILHLACSQGHVEMVKYILSLNIDGVGIESRGLHGRTPVMAAVFFEQMQVIEMLVSQGCNLSVATTGGNTILHIACGVGNVDIVKYIMSLETGNEKRKNKYDYTPVQTAETHGYSSIAALLRDWQYVKT